MTNIKSKTVTINKSAQSIFDYTTNLINFEHLLPMDKLSDWKADEKSCSFKIQGSVNIGLLLDSTVNPSQIVIKSSPNTPFPFTLNIQLDESNGSTTISQLCEADINPFLKMMVEKPLKNLFDYIADRLEVVSKDF